MIRSPLAVVKVGGSLIDWPELPARLGDFLKGFRRVAPGENPVLIAGGGPAADLIRRLDRVHHLGDETAHELALHAMDLTARILVAILPDARPVVRAEGLDRAWQDGRVPVLIAATFLDDLERAGCDPLPASWDVTSDTIAARIAVHLSARRLVLIKSAPLPRSANCRDAAGLGLVDPKFPDAARSLARIEYLNLRDPTGRLEQLPP